jgi:hypothetical protein
MHDSTQLAHRHESSHPSRLQHFERWDTWQNMFATQHSTHNPLNASSSAKQMDPSASGGEAACGLCRDGGEDAEDGLLKQDNDDARRCCQSRSTRLAKAAAPAAFLAVVGAMVLIRARNQRWSRPAMWSSSCDQVLSTTSLAFTCSRRGAKNAACTIANKLFLLCDGQHWEKERSSTSWVGICREGMCSAIWQDSHDCSTLEFDGWQDVCLEEGAMDDDLANAECRLNQWCGMLTCSAKSGFEHRCSGDGQHTSHCS